LHISVVVQTAVIIKDDDGCKLSVLVAGEAGRMPKGLAPVEKTYPLHRLCRSVSGQHAPDDSWSVFLRAPC